MSWQWTPFALPALLSTAACVIVFFYVRRYRHAPGAGALATLGVAAGFWALMQSLGVSVADLESKLLCAKIQYLGIVATPVCWFAFALDYGGRGAWRRRPALLGLLILPLTTFLLVLTNERHGLIWSVTRLSEDAPFVALVVEHGPWFLLHAVYNYALVAVATGLLGWTLLQAPRARPQLWAVIAAPAAVLAPNLLYLSRFNPSPYLDLTPLGIGVAALLMGVALLRFRMFELPPLAREAIVEGMGDPVLVIDEHGRVADLNPAARELLGVGRERLGRPIAEALPAELAGSFAGGAWPTAAPGGVEIELGGRSFEVRDSPLAEPGRGRLGRILVLRDVTERRRTEISLLRAESELRAANQRLATLAYTDSLTGLGSRAFFLDRLREECARSRRHGLPLALLLVDLDHFKRVNDEFGHIAGDRVLVGFGALLLGIRRESDVAGRLGGEEFGLLLGETTIEGARQLGERIRALTRETPFATGEGHEVRMTLSGGIAGFHGDDEREQLLRRADRALYRAKAAGRDRIEVESGPER